MSRFISIGENFDLHCDLVDYTQPWSTKQPETFLLHHGAWRNMEFFRTWVPLLGDSFRVLRIDARGSGDSSKPDDGYTVQQFADDAASVVQALGISKVHWVGESSGGMVGLRFALSHPDRLASLTLCNTPLKRRKEIGIAYTLGEKSQEDAIRKFGVREFCRRTMPFRIDKSRTSPEMAEWILQEMEKTPAHVAIGLHTDIGKQDFGDSLRAIEAPTLMLVSSASDIAGESQVEQMSTLMPQAKIVSFPGIGHGLNLLEPRWCVDQIRSFLQASASR